MKDANGLYYYPNTEHVTTRVYVRNSSDGIEFRLWQADRPEVWEKHGWLPVSVLEAAAVLYKKRGTGSDPMALYDIRVAQALLK